MCRLALVLLTLSSCYRDAGGPQTPPPAPEAEPAAAAPKKRAAPAPTKAAVCDEVSCVLDNYAGPCCTRFRKRPPPGPAPANPTMVDRAMITTAIAAVKGQLIACGNQTSATGTVKVAVKIAPDGSITSINVKESVDPVLDACVVAALSLASFPPTDSGGSFVYPFVF
jgi:TonB family protein